MCVIAGRHVGIMMEEQALSLTLNLQFCTPAETNDVVSSYVRKGKMEPLRSSSFRKRHSPEIPMYRVIVVSYYVYRKLLILRRFRKEDASVYNTRKSEKPRAESNTQYAPVYKMQPLWCYYVLSEHGISRCHHGAMVHVSTA